VRHVSSILFVGAWALLVIRPGLAQVPETFENLQVLGNDVERRTLIETMRGFSFELGARCEYCHVGGPALDTIDFVSDEKASKRTARQMLRMTREINETQLSKLESSTLEVTCFTCHRGVLRPEPVESLMAAEIEANGLEAAVAHYRELRDENLEKGAYSFGVPPLNRLGERLLAEGKPQLAVAVLELNAEFHPDSAWLQDLLGDAYLQSGDRDQARAAFEKSLALSPENPRTREKLEALRKPDPR
jgi:tetratricopeptide (TPR) repeat protein